MKIIRYLSIALMFFMAVQVFAADSDDSAKLLSHSDKDYKAAEKVIQQYFHSFEVKDAAQLEKLLMPAFQEVDAEKLYDHKAEMDSIKTTSVEKTKVSDLNVMKSGDILIVTYKVQAQENINGKQVFPKPFYRLTILQERDGNWYMLAHANPAQVASN